MRLAPARMAILALLLAGPGAHPAVAEEGQPQALASTVEAETYAACIEAAHRDPEGAVGRATAWQVAGGGPAAERCLSLAYLGLREYAKAAEAVARLARGGEALDPVQRSALLGRGGRLWLMAGNAEEAYALQTEALAIAPTDVRVLIDRSISLTLRDQPWEAIDDLHRAIDTEPTNAEALVFRAILYRQLSSLELARDDLDRALASRPDHPDGLYERGEVRRLQGDERGARGLGPADRSRAGHPRRGGGTRAPAPARPAHGQPGRGHAGADRG